MHSKLSKGLVKAPLIAKSNAMFARNYKILHAIHLLHCQSYASISLQKAMQLTATSSLITFVAVSYAASASVTCLSNDFHFLPGLLLQL